MENMQWARGLFPLFLTTCTWVLMTSPAVLSSDHSSSKASSVLLISMSSIVAGQNTAAVPSLSSVSMSSSKVFHSSTLALSSSSFVALSSGMAKELSTPALPLGSSKLVSSLPVVSKSVARLSRSSRSESSSVAMNSSWAFEQGTSAVTSVSSLLLSSSTISASSLQQSHLTAVVVGTTLEIDKSTPETPSPSSMLLPSSTVGSQQSECPTMAFLNETSGVITSPFYPRDYPNAVTCRWKITASRGKRIKLVITDMYLEWGGNHCPYDYLRIQNGFLYDSGVPYEPMCGRLTGNVTFYSFRETLTVLFVTDGSVTYRGFNATYIQLHFAGIPYTEAPSTNDSEITPTTIDITTPITIPENKGTVLNCTKDRFDGKHEWSRKDGEPAVTTTRILTEDTRLNITDASVEDAGEYICRNGPTVTHRFVVTVEVFVKVQMIVKVLNYEYTPELQNKSSPAYKATEKNFTAEMDKLYKNTPGYVRTEVLNFTKGSVNVDFRVIIVINAIDPKNASAIPDAKAETTHQVVREAKTGFVKQLQVSPVVEVFSPPLEPRGIEIFEEKSDKLGVRWEPSEDADAFKVQSYHVQYRELLTKIPQNASVPSTEKKDTYTYLIKDLEPKTTYMIRVGAENRHGINFNEERAHKTLAPPFAEWIIVLIVLGILLVTGIIVGLIVFTRRRAEQRRRRLEEQEDGRFGGLSGDVRLASVPNYETRNVKGIKFSFANKSFMPSEANWKEIPYEKITLMNELGSGAFGVVYKGELKQDNGNVTPCAVKTLKESATTEEMRDLYNELEIMTNVGYHPNLVNLLGACTQDGPLLVVIEIAENGNLLELLRKSRETNQNYGNIQGTVLTSDTRLRIAADVAKGMAHLANGRWIHRDLAARNVLLAKNYVAKVADYGMARDIYEQLMYKKETQGKLPVKWMAIESLETYIFTTESDVWSYGVLLWEMESGGLKPYAGLSTTELIDQLKKGYRLEKPDGCSDAVYQIMRDCWNPNPKSRPTFDDLVTRLENMAVSS